MSGAGVAAAGAEAPPAWGGAVGTPAKAFGEAGAGGENDCIFDEATGGSDCGEGESCAATPGDGGPAGSENVPPARRLTQQQAAFLVVQAYREFHAEAASTGGTALLWRLLAQQAKATDCGVDWLAAFAAAFDFLQSTDFAEAVAADAAPAGGAESSAEAVGRKRVRTASAEAAAGPSGEPAPPPAAGAPHAAKSTDGTAGGAPPPAAESAAKAAAAAPGEAGAAGASPGRMFDDDAQSPKTTAVTAAPAAVTAAPPAAAAVPFGVACCVLELLQPFITRATGDPPKVKLPPFDAACQIMHEAQAVAAGYPDGEAPPEAPGFFAAEPSLLLALDAALGAADQPLTKRLRRFCEDRNIRENQLCRFALRLLADVAHCVRERATAAVGACRAFAADEAKGAAATAAAVRKFADKIRAATGDAGTSESSAADSGGTPWENPLEASIHLQAFCRQFEKVTDLLPDDLRAGTGPACEKCIARLAKFQQMEEAEQRKKLAAARETDRQQAENRDALRTASATYILKNVLLYTHAHPLAILGINPRGLSLQGLSTLKRKLRLLLHPDKCTNPGDQERVSQAFVAATQAMQQTSDFFADEKWQSKLPTIRTARDPPPYAQFCDIAPVGSHSFWVPRVVLPPGSRARDGPLPPQNEAQPAAAPVRAFSCAAFADLLGSSDGEHLRFTAVDSVAPPVLFAIELRARELYIRAASSHGANRYVRAFILRPFGSLETRDGPRLENAGKIQEFEKLLAAEELGEAKPLAHAATMLLLGGAQSVLTATVPIHAGVQPYDALTFRNACKPLLADSSGVKPRMLTAVGLQVVDTAARKCSKIAWLPLDTPQLNVPGTKAAVLSSLLLFATAPPAYRAAKFAYDCLDDGPKRTTDVFPSLSFLRGQSSAALKETLVAVVQGATEALARPLLQQCASD